MEQISAENFVLLEKHYKTTAFIYAVQIFSALSLLTVGYFIIQPAATDARSESATLLWVVILFIAIGTFLLRRVLFRWERFKDTALLKGVRGVLATLQTNSIILGALAESIVIFGFVLAIMNGSKGDLIRAVLVGLIVFAINFPRKSVWEKIAANLEKV